MRDLINFARRDVANYLATQHGDAPDASKAEVMVAAAEMVIGLPYEMGGNGWLNSIDGYGFIRWCVRAAEAWVPRLGLRFHREIACASVSRSKFASLTGEPDADQILPYIEAWGLQRVNEIHPIKTQPGDIVLSLGNGPGAVIVMQGSDHPEGELVAGIWCQSSPQIRADAGVGRSRVRVYRWPSARAVV